MKNMIKAAVCLAVILCLSASSLFISYDAKAESTFVPRTSLPSANESAYKYYFNTNYSPFYPYYAPYQPFQPRPSGGYVYGNCTWYAYARAYEILGKRPNLCTGNANTWFEYNRQNGYYPYGYTPRVGAIVCYGNNGTNHVAVVEKIVDGVPYVSESGWAVSYSYPSQVRFHYGTAYGTGGWGFSKSDITGYIYLLDESSVNNDISVADMGNDFCGKIKNEPRNLCLTNVNGVPKWKEDGSSAYQNWHFLKQKDSTYTISDMGNKNYLTYDKASNTLSIKAQDNSSKQKFKFLEKGSFYCIQPYDTERVIDIWIDSYDSQQKSYLTELTYYNSSWTSQKYILTEAVYTITYDTNGGFIGPANQTKKHNQAINLSIQTPKRNFYTFVGWSKTKNGAVDYNSGDIYEENRDITLYAVWKPDNQSNRVIYGDVNNDGEVNMMDIVELQKIIAGSKEASNYEKLVADLNNDNELNMMDVIIIQKYISEM